VEPVPQVEPDRERVVADPLVEPAVDAAERPLVGLHRHRVQVVDVKGGDVPRQARRPRLGVLPSERERCTESAVQRLFELVDDATVEEHPGRERVRDDDPDGLVHARA
jgi:hypothetical protein